MSNRLLSFYLLSNKLLSFYLLATELERKKGSSIFANIKIHHNIKHRKHRVFTEKLLWSGRTFAWNLQMIKLVITLFTKNVRGLAQKFNDLSIKTCFYKVPNLSTIVSICLNYVNSEVLTGSNSGRSTIKQEYPQLKFWRPKREARAIISFTVKW